MLNPGGSEVGVKSTKPEKPLMLLRVIPRLIG
jgi:hypothetical protein